MKLHRLMLRLGYSYPGAVTAEIGEALCYAHVEHPHFAENESVALRILGEEFGEVCKALNEGDTDGAIKELAQVNAVTVRFMELLMGVQK